MSAYVKNVRRCTYSMQKARKRAEGVANNGTVSIEALQRCNQTLNNHIP